MKKIPCFLVFLALTCVVQADNKKKQPASKGGAAHAPSGMGRSAPAMSRGPMSSRGSSQIGGSHIQSHSNHISSASGSRSSTSKTNNPLKKTSSHAASTSHGANPLTKSSGQTSASKEKSNPLAQKAPNAAAGNQSASHALTQTAHPGTSVAAHGVHPAYANYHVQPYREVFRDYHRVYRDRGWYGAHYDRLVVVGGGYYYWNAGYWYPAWGYDPAFVGYAYDGPIYSYANLPPDQVVVNVQTALQDQGYYTGDVDGQLGPQTRDAVASYQKDHDLEVTSAVDEPTVEALGLTS